jgi:hypothetical protein
LRNSTSDIPGVERAPAEVYQVREEDDGHVLFRQYLNLCTEAVIRSTVTDGLAVTFMSTTYQPTPW